MTVEEGNFKVDACVDKASVAVDEASVAICLSYTEQGVTMSRE